MPARTRTVAGAPPATRRLILLPDPAAESRALPRRVGGLQISAGIRVAGVVVACGGVAAASLLLPSQPTFDPWAWLIWGRELTSLDLDTHAGPSWKPLPVLINALFAPLGKLDDGLPPAVWLVIARTAGLLALVLAFRVAGRLTQRPGWVAATAGVLTAAGLLLSPNWLRYMAHGNEVPMAVGLMLGAVLRHLDGARGQALLLGFLACLLRPEVFPFLALYALLVWRSQPSLRRLVVGLGLALPVLWLVPEWVGSGDPFGALSQARSEPSTSLSLFDHPWLALLERWQRMAGLPFELAALGGVGFALQRRQRVPLALAGLAVAWIALVAAMTQAGFSGNGRYLLPAFVVILVLSGYGVALALVGAADLAGRLASPLGRARRRSFRLAGAVATAVPLLFLAAPELERRVDRLQAQAETVAPLARLHRQLELAVRRTGGPNAITPYGAVTVNRAFVTHLAWELKVPIGFIESGRKQGVVFTAVPRLAGATPPLGRPRWSLLPLVRAGAWSVDRAPG